MGRRSVNTTKSGKYMNPTDQARKIARKKELKKNKKQRNAVRLAVLKNKDPFLILDEMEKIDKMEYDPTQPPPLNERVLKEKRRKLKETYERVINMYEREDAEYVLELRKAEVEYEKQREQRILYYEQVKNVEKVKLDKIPLPDAPSYQAVGSDMPLPGDIPLPPPARVIHGILKKTPHIKGKISMEVVAKKTVGPPPGTPPSFSDNEDESTSDRKKRIRFDDASEEKDSRTKYKLLAQSMVSSNEEDEGDDDQDRLSDDSSGDEINPQAIRLPPGPPPSLPPGPPPNFNQMIFRMPRLPIPPSHPIPPHLLHPMPGMGVLSGPARLQRPAEDLLSHAPTQNPTIQAKPKIKNLIGDATKFVPVALRINRKNNQNKSGDGRDKSEASAASASSAAAAAAQTKDDAYDSFMKEMQGLI